MNKNYLLILLLGILTIGCNPEAKWADNDVEVTINLETVSAGFAECSFSTNKDAYYLIAIEEARDDYDPMTNKKNFMMLALDSANLNYLFWRNELLKNGEYNIANFASHALQYGEINHFFTGLLPSQKYWIYAFAVNPETLQPIGTLKLITINTKDESEIDINFEYRVKNDWDYVYPMDTKGNLFARFPYIATTRDSLELIEYIQARQEEYGVELTEITAVKTYFLEYVLDLLINPKEANVLYGVSAIENDGIHSHLIFEEGHTYYTGIAGFDGGFKQMAVYKFKWEGEKTNLYFYDTDSTNMMKMYEDLPD